MALTDGRPLTKAEALQIIADSASAYLGFTVAGMGGTASLNVASLREMAAAYSEMAVYKQTYRKLQTELWRRNTAYTQEERDAIYAKAQAYAAQADAIWARPVKSFKVEVQ